MDPLRLIREFFVNKREREILLGKNDVIIGGKKYLKSLKTNYRVLYDYDAVPREEAPQYYTLDAVLYLLVHSELKYSEYARKASTANIQVVEFPDKNNLLDYLKGKIPAPKAVDDKVAGSWSEVPKRCAGEDDQLPKRSRGSLELTDEVRDPRVLRMEAPIDSGVPEVPDTKPESKSRRTAALARGDYWKLIPIIIIPEGEELSLITMRNAHGMLQNLHFVAPEAAPLRQQASGPLITRRNRNRGGLPELYRLVDDPLRLEMDDWDRVVGIFVVGLSFEFKDWPFTMDEIFYKFPLFHVKYGYKRINPNIGSWPVTLIEISRTDRRLNRAAIASFWKTLDANLNAKLME